MTESTAPFKGNVDPQSYALASSLTYYWDVATLEWVKGTQPAAGGGGAVTIADGADVAQGAVADAAWVAGDGTVIAILKAIAGSAGGGLTDAELRATPVPVTIDNPAGAAAVNIQDGGNTITVDGTVAVSGSVSVTGPLTDAELRATPVPVSGTVTANPTGYITRLDEASSTITYVGQAAPGTATSSASWSIKRLDSTTGLLVLYAAGTAAFSQIWDNRAALAYS